MGLKTLKKQDCGRAAGGRAGGQPRDPGRAGVGHQGPQEVGEGGTVPLGFPHFFTFQSPFLACSLGWSSFS